MEKRLAAGREKGWFLRLNKGQVILKKNLDKNFDFKRKKCGKKFNEDISALNFQILRKLTLSTKKSPLVKGKYEPSKSFVNFLTENFQIKKSFQSAHDLLTVFNLADERYFNESDFCKIKKDSFKIKISKKI